MDYDKTLAVGDIVTAYEKGIWRIEEIIPRQVTEEMLKYRAYSTMKVGDEMVPSVRCTKLFDSKMKPIKGNRASECNIAWCERVSVKTLRKEAEDFLKLRRAAALSLFGEDLGL